MSHNANPKLVKSWTVSTITGLFSGIGGLELGLERSGATANMMCEIDKAAQAVLRTRFEGVPLLGDVREVEALPQGTDLLCAGFPCQDLSSSGQKAGMDGTQSSLVTEVFRILRARPVEWVVIENVAFMLNLKGGEAVRTIVSSLEELGYRWAYRVLDSNAWVPQRRKRVYFVASLHHDPRTVLLSDDYPTPAEFPTGLDQPIGFYWTEGTYATGLNLNGVPPLKGGSTIGIPSPPAVLMPDGSVGTPDIRDAERLQGFDSDWTIPAVEVAKPSVRWKLVGNAVTVRASEWIGGKLANPVFYDEAMDSPLSASGPWPTAAWCMGQGRYASTVSDSPVPKNAEGLGEFLDYPLKPLSLKATLGFLSRARKGSLRFPDGFLDALDRYCLVMEASQHAMGDSPRSRRSARSVGDSGPAE